METIGMVIPRPARKKMKNADRQMMDLKGQLYRFMHHPSDQVKHSNILSEHIGVLCLNNKYSDVTLVVQDTRIPAHKIILASRNEYFRSLLFGGMKESRQDEIQLEDVVLDAFKILLQYIYTGCITLTSLTVSDILDLLDLVHKYLFTDLEVSICNHLSILLKMDNVYEVFVKARFFQLKSLAAACLTYIDQHATEIMAENTFLNLPTMEFKAIISRESFYANEVDVFRWVCRWLKHNEVLKHSQELVLSEIRLEQIDVSDLVHVVLPTDLFSKDVILGAIKCQCVKCQI